MLHLIYKGVLERTVPDVVLWHRPHWHSLSAGPLAAIGGSLTAFAFGITTPFGDIAWTVLCAFPDPMSSICVQHTVNAAGLYRLAVVTPLLY